MFGACIISVGYLSNSGDFLLYGRYLPNYNARYKVELFYFAPLCLVIIRRRLQLSN